MHNEGKMYTAQLKVNRKHKYSSSPESKMTTYDKLLGMYRIAHFAIQPNKNNSFYYSAEYK